MTSADFAAALRAWRNTHGWTQAQAAAALGVGLRTYERWEFGRAPSTGIAGMIARLMELQPASGVIKAMRKPRKAPAPD